MTTCRHTDTTDHFDNPRRFRCRDCDTLFVDSGVGYTALAAPLRRSLLQWQMYADEGRGSNSDAGLDYIDASTDPTDLEAVLWHEGLAVLRAAGLRSEAGIKEDPEREHYASLTLSPTFGAALWLDGRLVARIASDVQNSRVTPDDPVPQWRKDADVFVEAVNSRRTPGVDWRAIYVRTADKWSTVLEALDLAEDATPDDVLRVMRQRAYPA